MMRRRWRAVVPAGSIVVALASWQCSKPAAPPPPSSTSSFHQADMKSVVSVKELMEFMIDPIADNIFDAVWWDVTPKGTIAHTPTTDDDWDKIQTGAVSIAEGIYLLKVPRPWTPPGDVNNSTGPNPPELSPAQIQAKLDKDPVLWDAKIEALRNVAREVMEIVKKRDANALFEASADLDEACEACHLEYWYPGDRAAVEEDKQQRARYIKKTPAPQKP